MARPPIDPRNIKTSLRALACSALLLLSATSRAEDVQVITHPDRADIELDRQLLRVLFTMRLRQWPDGHPIRVFVLPDNDPIHARFCRESLGTFPYVLRGVWDRMVFTGTGFAPEVVNSADEMRRRVNNTPGAVGYVLPDTLGAIIRQEASAP